MSSMPGHSFIYLEKHADSRGELHVAESFKNIPFDIRRVFYVFGVPEETKRAGHAHKECRQVLICLRGKIEIILSHGNGYPAKVNLEGTPGIGLLVETCVHIEYTMSDDAILLVLASKEYRSADYFSFMEEEYSVPVIEELFGATI